MLIILLLVIVAVGASATLCSNKTETVMDEYSRLESRERKIQDYSICC